MPEDDTAVVPTHALRVPSEGEWPSPALLPPPAIPLVAGRGQAGGQAQARSHAVRLVGTGRGPPCRMRDLQVRLDIMGFWTKAEGQELGRSHRQAPRKGAAGARP